MASWLCMVSLFLFDKKKKKNLAFLSQCGYKSVVLVSFSKLLNVKIYFVGPSCLAYLTQVFASAVILETNRITVALLGTKYIDCAENTYGKSFVFIKLLSTKTAILKMLYIYFTLSCY